MGRFASAVEPPHSLIRSNAGLGPASGAGATEAGPIPVIARRFRTHRTAASVPDLHTRARVLQAPRAEAALEFGALEMSTEGAEK